VQYGLPNVRVISAPQWQLTPPCLRLNRNADRRKTVAQDFIQPVPLLVDNVAHSAPYLPGVATSTLQKDFVPIAKHPALTRKWQLAPLLASVAMATDGVACNPVHNVTFRKFFQKHHLLQ